MDKYAVVGNPIQHSKSPQIHQAFAKQFNEVIAYEALLVELDDFEKYLDQFFNEGGKGLNVTVPFKLRAHQYADKLSDCAKLAGAVNTLIKNKDGTITGDNTDGIGLVEDIINNHQTELAGKNVLVLGAGGAVRGILEPLLKQQPKQVTIVNRTAAKITELQTAFSTMAEIKATTYEELAQHSPYDMIINGTSASLSGDLPPLPDNICSSKTFCYDMMYAASDTAFLHWAKQHHCEKMADGLGMLVGQAAVSYFLWRALKPDTCPVINSLRKGM